jgi:hypothetical protein
MSAPESTAVIPPAPPAPAHATPEQISALHRRLDDLERWAGEKFHELLHLIEKAGPLLSAAGAPVAAVVAKVAGVADDVFSCCGHEHLGVCATDCPVCSKP